MNESIADRTRSIAVASRRTAKLTFPDSSDRAIIASNQNTLRDALCLAVSERSPKAHAIRGGLRGVFLG